MGAAEVPEPKSAEREPISRLSSLNFWTDFHAKPIPVRLKTLNRRKGHEEVSWAPSL
jgi:hypothetical protein